MGELSSRLSLVYVLKKTLIEAIGNFPLLLQCFLRCSRYEWALQDECRSNGCSQKQGRDSLEFRPVPHLPGDHQRWQGEMGWAGVGKVLDLDLSKICTGVSARVTGGVDEVSYEELNIVPRDFQFCNFWTSFLSSCLTLFHVVSPSFYLDLHPRNWKWFVTLQQEYAGTTCMIYDTCVDIYIYTYIDTHMYVHTQRTLLFLISYHPLAVTHPSGLVPGGGGGGSGRQTPRRLLQVHGVCHLSGWRRL